MPHLVEVGLCSERNTMDATPEQAERRGRQRIWLIGLMGSGKSTTGRLIASAIGARYVDNDTTIAALAGRSTVELGVTGAEILHTWESRFVHFVADLDPPLVAGIPASIAERPDDLALLRSRGLLVYLRADAQTLAARVAVDPPRPLLGDTAAASLGAMVAARDSRLTAAASVVVDATQTLEAVVRAILAVT